MVYGHYITDTVGNQRFFVEGCSYCQMSTGGQHEPNCPYMVGRIVEPQTLPQIKMRVLNNKLWYVNEDSPKDFNGNKTD